MMETKVSKAIKILLCFRRVTITHQSFNVDISFTDSNLTVGSSWFSSCPVPMTTRLVIIFYAAKAHIKCIRVQVASGPSSTLRPLACAVWRSKVSLHTTRTPHANVDNYQVAPDIPLQSSHTCHLRSPAQHCSGGVGPSKAGCGTLDLHCKTELSACQLNCQPVSPGPWWAPLRQYRCTCHRHSRQRDLVLCPGAGRCPRPARRSGCVVTQVMSLIKFTYRTLHCKSSPIGQPVSTTPRCASLRRY